MRTNKHLIYVVWLKNRIYKRSIKLKNYENVLNVIRTVSLLSKNVWKFKGYPTQHLKIIIRMFHNIVLKKS